jgi:hypothetical protein
MGLVKASVLRKDGKEKGFRSKTSGVVHNSCRREYVKSDSIKRFLRESLVEQPSTSRDASSLSLGQVKFDFKTKCLFCTETYDKEKERKNLMLLTIKTYFCYFFMNEGGQLPPLTPLVYKSIISKKKRSINMSNYNINIRQMCRLKNSWGALVSPQTLPSGHTRNEKKM